MANSAPVRLSPLHSATAALGAAYAERAGWQIPAAYGKPDSELAAARAGVALADTSALGKLLVEGASAAQKVQAALGAAPAQVGAGLAFPGGRVFQVRPNQFFVVTDIGAEGAVLERLTSAAAPGLVTVTDVTQGLAAASVIGPRARSLLGQLSALDFSDAAFANQTLKATSLAKARHLIIRQDRGGLPAFTLFVAQSLSAYVWSVLRDAGHSLDMAPLGWTAWESLAG